MGIFGKTESKPVQQPPRPGTPPAAKAPAKPASRTPAPSATTDCVIGPKTAVKGDITGDENVLVEGTVEGTVKAGKAVVVGNFSNELKALRGSRNVYFARKPCAGGILEGFEA